MFVNLFMQYATIIKARAVEANRLTQVLVHP